MDTEISLTLFRNMMDVYESICQPVCRKGGISQTAFTILMFLASNPEHYTAKDVSTFRAIKPNIVSFNVEKLVKAGYLERQPIPGNRRSIKLVCTEKAEPMIKEGLKVIDYFLSSITAGLSRDDFIRLHEYLEMIENNVVAMKERLKKGKALNV